MINRRIYDEMGLTIIFNVNNNFNWNFNIKTCQNMNWLAQPSGCFSIVTVILIGLSVCRSVKYLHKCITYSDYDSKQLFPLYILSKLHEH